MSHPVNCNFAHSSSSAFRRVGVDSIREDLGAASSSSATGLQERVESLRPSIPILSFTESPSNLHPRSSIDQNKSAATDYKLGTYYEKGKGGVPPDRPKAIFYYNKAAEQGHIEAQYSLGECYFENFEDDASDENFNQAIKWFRKAAEKGHCEAQYSLGYCLSYYSGYSSSDDEELGNPSIGRGEEIDWYRKAAEQGHREAQFLLGEYYFEGVDIEQDFAEAVDWFTQAAEQGHCQAQFLLAKCYLNGEGVDQNFAEAAHWCEEAAKRGYREAQEKLIYIKEQIELINARS